MTPSRSLGDFDKKKTRNNLKTEMHTFQSFSMKICVYKLGCKQNTATETIYRNIDFKVATLMKLFRVIYKKILVPLLIITPIVISFTNYISTDYSNESFLQVFPAT